MANERRNERIKLIGSWCNTLSASVITLGTAAPIIVGVYDWFRILDPARPLVDNWQIPVFWLMTGLAIHIIGQIALELIIEKEAADDE